MRRKLEFVIVTSAAVILLQGCQKTNDTKQQGDALADIRNIDPSAVTFGDLPIKYSDPSVFNPKHTVLVYIKLTPTGSLFSRVYHFNANGAKDFSGTKSAIQTAVTAMIANPTKPPAGHLNETVKRTLRDFDMSAQSNVVVFIDNKDLAFRETPLFFTRYLHSGREAEKNKSFYDAERVTLNILGETRPALYFKNYRMKWKADETQGGSPIGEDSPPLRYAFNFNLNMPDAENPKYSEQLIIDPDGGNVGSEPPPP